MYDYICGGWVWTSCFQVLRLLYKELRIRTDKDLQRKQDNFIWIKERDTLSGLIGSRE